MPTPACCRVLPKATAPKAEAREQQVLETLDFTQRKKNQVQKSEDSEPGQKAPQLAFLYQVTPGIVQDVR